MALVADEDDNVPLARETHGLEVDLGHQRTGGVDGAQTASIRRRPDGRGDAVRAIKQGPAFGHFLDAVDENHAALAEALDDRAVVDDFVVDVERRAEQLERTIETLDRHVDAGTESPRVGQDDLHVGSLLVVLIVTTETGARHGNRRRPETTTPPETGG